MAVLDKKSFMNNMVLWSGMLSYMLLLVMRFILAEIIGDVGVGCFAPAFEIYMITSMFLSYSITKSLSLSIKVQVKKEQYANARKILNETLLITFVVSAMLSVVLFFFSDVAASSLLLEPNAAMAIKFVFPCMVFSSILGCFRGYFNGFGFGGLFAMSNYLEKILIIVLAVIGSKFMSGYGAKVAALLQLPIQENAYGAMGAVLGMACAQLLAAIHCVVMYLLYAGYFRGGYGEERVRKLDTGYAIAQRLLSNSIPIALICMFINGMLLIDQRFFNSYMNTTEQMSDRTLIWGIFYGKGVTVIGIGALLCCLSVYPYFGKIAGAYRQDEQKIMRDRIARCIKKLCMIMFPVSVFMAAYAEVLAKGIFRSNTELLTQIFANGAILAATYSITYTLLSILLKVHMLGEVVISTSVCYLLHLPVAYLLINKLKLGIIGVIYSQTVFFVMLSVISIFFVARYLSYRQEWIVSVAFPAVSAGITGVILLVISRFLLESAGGMITLLVGITAGFLLYITLLMVFRVISENDLNKLPFGELFMAIGRMIGVIR